MDELDLEGVAGIEALREHFNGRETPIARARRVLTPLMRRGLIVLHTNLDPHERRDALRRYVRAGSGWVWGLPDAEDWYTADTINALWGEGLLAQTRSRRWRLTDAGREVAQALAAEEAT